MKYAWIKQNCDLFTVVMMCRVLGVSKSGFYKARSAKPSPRAQRHTRIRQAVKHVHEQSFGIYGSYKIAQKIQHDEQLESACRNTVASAMQEMGLKSRVSKRFKPTTTVVDPHKQPADNLLDRDFSATAPNRKWVTDITYLPSQSGWVYLAVVMDLFSRKIVGWSISNSLATSLVSNALRNAVESRCPDTHQLLHHSDRGCQYTSDAYQRILNTLGIECSMSRTACCYDNAVMERYFWSLKHEWTNFHSFQNLQQARLSVFRYIETFYNSVRIHQTLNYQSPNDFEHRYTAHLAG